MCDLWILDRSTSGLRDLGTTHLSSIKTIPSCAGSSSRILRYGVMSCRRLFTHLKLLFEELASCCLADFLYEFLRNWLWRVAESRPFVSLSMVSTSSRHALIGRGALERVSARYMRWPGLKPISRSYFCRRSNIPCKRLGRPQGVCGR